MGQRYVRTYGGVEVTLTGDDAGMRRMLVDDMFLPTLNLHANRSAARARAIAASYPERSWPNEGSLRRTGKRYVSSFDTDYGVGINAEGEARVQARVINTNPFAFYIEYGNKNIRPARRIVRSATGINRFDAEGDIYG